MRTLHHTSAIRSTFWRSWSRVRGSASTATECGTSPCLSTKVLASKSSSKKLCAILRPSSTCQTKRTSDDCRGSGSSTLYTLWLKSHSQTGHMSAYKQGTRGSSMSRTWLLTWTPTSFAASKHRPISQVSTLLKTLPAPVSDSPRFCVLVFREMWIIFNFSTD